MTSFAVLGHENVRLDTEVTLVGVNQRNQNMALMQLNSDTGCGWPEHITTVSSNVAICTFRSERLAALASSLGNLHLPSGEAISITAGRAASQADKIKLGSLSASGLVASRNYGKGKAQRNPRAFAKMTRSNQWFPWYSSIVSFLNPSQQREVRSPAPIPATLKR